MFSVAQGVHREITTAIWIHIVFDPTTRHNMNSNGFRKLRFTYFPNCFELSGGGHLPVAMLFLPSLFGNRCYADPDSVGPDRRISFWE